MLTYSAEKRNEILDEFLTPPGLAQAMVNLATRYIPYKLIRTLDPGANTGVFGEFLTQIFPYSVRWGVELMDVPQPPWYPNWVHTDFLEWTPDIKFDLIIGNPPFSDYRSGKRQTVCDKWVLHSLELLEDGGFLIFLLRSNFRFSAERYALLNEHPYLAVYDCLPRPSFYRHDPRTKQFGSKQTNAHDYSVFVWKKGHTQVTQKWLLWNYT